MNKITKNSILTWQGIEDIRDIDLNIVQDYLTDAFVCIKHEISPVAYMLLSPYCNKASFKLINEGIEFKLQECNLTNFSGEIKLVCKDVTGKIFEFKYNDSMRIILSCTNIDLKVAILKFRAMYELSECDNPPLTKLLAVEE